MNDTANGHARVVLEPVESSDSGLLPRIHEALQLIHNPYSTNESRKDAFVYLERVKDDPAAPDHGFTLAIDRNQQFVVRHFALSLLEHAIIHKWNQYSGVQAEALRGWVLQLAESISSEDPLYLRNKIAQIWVEIAKRCWGQEWTDMDELLAKLWSVPDSLVHKELVLSILETLSEDIFNGEDTTAALREGVLNKACVEIFTPDSVLVEVFPDRQILTGLRYGNDGWLVRVGVLLETCLANDAHVDEPSRICAVQCLTLFRSVMPWITSLAITKASCVRHMRNCLAIASVPVQMVSCYDWVLYQNSVLITLGIPRRLQCNVSSIPVFRR